MEAALLLLNEYLLWGPQTETWLLLELHFLGGQGALPLSFVPFHCGEPQPTPSLSHGPHTCLTTSLSASPRKV